MEKLTDFKPIEKLCLPNLGELSCAGLIVIVGPNSSGKSQLLRDISQKISGEPRELVVAEEMELAKLDYRLLLKCLQAEGYISSFWDDNDREQYMPMTTAIGTGQGAQNVGTEQLEQWRTRSESAPRGRRKDEYFGWFSRFLVTALFLENRLTSMSAVNTIDFETQPPTHDLHALHLNDAARDALTLEIQRAFSKAIWSDISKGNQICLRIGENGQIPSAEDRLSVRQMAKYRTLASEGDGMKSYVATVISLLLGRRPVSVIDEPEMCLHPPQAYNLGQFVGTTGTSKQTATFVATHSSQILRGVLQTAEELQIVRLTRSQTGFSAKHVDSALLEEAMRKPTVRAETVLDGIFAQAVTIIEADGDRIVYQSAWEVVGQNLGFDIHFAAVGGTGGIADTCQLYKMLGIPVAIVADLDLITDVEKLKVVLKSISQDADRTDSLVNDARRLAKALQELPPTVTEEEVREALVDLSTKQLDWTKGNDRDVRRSLSDLSNRLNGMRGLKRGGINALPPHVSEPLRSLVDGCGGIGLFLVPVGELEWWLGEYAISASREKKWAWANEAADFLRTNPEKEGDIWAFMRGVGQYLTEQFH